MAKNDSNFGARVRNVSSLPIQRMTERQNAEIRKDVKERHNEEDRQQCRGEEVHLRHVDPVGEHERDADVRDVDQLRESGRSGCNHLAPDLERGQEPREHEVQREQRGDRTPLDLLAVP